MDNRSNTYVSFYKMQLKLNIESGKVFAINKSLFNFHHINIRPIISTVNLLAYIA